MKNNITKEEITEIINLAWDSVVASKAGKIVNKTPDGQIHLHNIGMQSFLSILNSLCPKNIKGDFQMEDPGEDWKK